MLGYSAPQVSAGHGVPWPGAVLSCIHFASSETSKKTIDYTIDHRPYTIDPFKGALNPMLD